MSDNETDLSQGLSTDTEPSVVTDSVVDLDQNSIFQARIFLEKNTNVYGAEVVVFSSKTNEPIDRILITDLNEFNKYRETINLIKNNYLPYTRQDKDNMSVILDYLSKETTPTVEETTEYNRALSDDSYLKQKGDLQSILENNVINTIGEDALNSHHEKEEIVINATHLNGIEEGKFEKIGHSHGNVYLNKNHESVVANDYNYGHVRVKDNLNTTTNNGDALSAKQGNQLKNDIANLSKKITNSWTYGTIKSESKGTLNYRVNELLHLFVLDFKYMDTSIFKKSTGIHELESSGSIDSRYRPTQRVNMPVYRGDIVIMFNTDGSVKVHNLSKHDSWNIRGQVMWYYK